MSTASSPRPYPRRSDLTDTSYRSSVDVQAAPAQVFAALTTLKGLRGWWTGDTTGSLRAGGQLRLEFKSVAEHIVMRVDECVRSTRVRWHCVEHTGLPEWSGTAVIFALSPAPKGPGTRIEFEHRGLTPALACYDDCHAGWRHFLSSLKSYLETGYGNPFDR